MGRRRVAAGVLTALIWLSAPQAHAELATPFAADSFHGLLDLRAGSAGGEPSWLDGGFGKGTVANREGASVRIPEAAVEWRPRFGFFASGVLSIAAQPERDPAVDAVEAYLKLRAPPMSAGRFSARLGMMYPPVSLEHEGISWSTPHMLSASAVNTWIGEEVKVIGAEASLERTFGAHGLTATGAVFGWNDTAGTLLTFRGWAMHELKTGAKSRLPLPPLSPFMATKQAKFTEPVLELDGRAGYYGRLEWRPPAPVVFDALYYDNAGDRIAVDARQWAWETRFLNVSARWDVDERTRLLAQVMNGETLMGFRSARGLWVDMGFRAAYLLAARDYGGDTVSGRFDWFEVADRTYRDIDNNDEQGWAVAAAWRHNITPNADVIAEALHIASDRPSRRLAGEQPRKHETQVQAALRLSF